MIIVGGPVGFVAGPIWPVPPAFVVFGPGGYFPPYPPASRIPYAPMMAPSPVPYPGIPTAAEPPRPRRTGNPAKAAELVTVGDRLFRAGNLPRAQFRYEQAVSAHPNSAAARVRLAEIALVRGQYTEAADRLREAQTAEPGWIEHASDVQALFPEPTKFAEQIARIEAYLQSRPDDRNAWLMLGAQWFLSGRVQLAADVFLRLDDPSHPPDETLQAFLDASKAK
jgi:tetratricopeptide (TPR) repeat protein